MHHSWCVVDNKWSCSWFNIPTECSLSQTVWLSSIQFTELIYVCREVPCNCTCSMRFATVCVLCGKSCHMHFLVLCSYASAAVRMVLEAFCFLVWTVCVRMRPLSCTKTISYKPLVGISTKFTMSVQLDTKMNWFDFEMKRFQVRVTARTHVGQIALWKAFSRIYMNVWTYFNEEWKIYEF